MAVQKLFTSRINSANGNTFIGDIGRMFYDPDTGIIAISDGVTPGGQPIQLSSLSGRIGDFSFSNNNMSTVNSDEDVNILSNGNGSINLIGQLSLQDPEGVNLLTINKNGFVDFYVSSDTFDSGIDISGNFDNDGIAPMVAGVLLHLTGSPNLPARLYVDGQNSFASMSGRRYNGTISAPTGVLANDIIAKYGAIPLLSDGNFVSPGRR